MPRYFFNIYDGEDIFDDVGTELSSVSDVRIYILTIAKVWIEREENHESRWCVEARDEDENIVGTVRFGVQPDNGSS